MKPYFIIAFIIFIFLPVLIIIGTGLLFPSKSVTKLSETDLFTTIHGSKIRYRILAKNDPRTLNDKKPVLILLQGFSNVNKNGEKLIPGFSSNTVIMLDPIGFGGSDAPDITYTLETQRKYIIAFLDALKIEKAILAGVSKGASISAWTAAHSPNRIHSSILISPSAYPGSMKKKWPYSWIYRPGIINHFAAGIIHSSIYKVLFPNSMGAQLVDLTNSYDVNFANALNKIKQPTLLLWSKNDKTSLYKFSNEYRSRIRNLTFIQMPERFGHNVFHHEPEKTTTIINKFLASTSSN
jgi:pimeloyl-ACP methyl ester carboxylesterase